MKVLVTGVKGQLGYDVVKELEKRGVEAKGVDIEDFDLTNAAQVMDYVTACAPDAVVHCAAFTAVDKAEEATELCFAVNAEGTGNIAKACKSVGAKLIYISTDYVYDGQGSEPFAPDSPKAPINKYGESKYLGELRAAEQTDKLFIVRISWVFGVNGGNFVRTMLKLGETRGELTVVDDQIGSPTYTADLAVLLADMVQTEKYGVYCATNEGYCSWAEFAQAIFDAAGADVKVLPISTEEYLQMRPQAAKRPKNSRMSKQALDDAGFKRLPPWQDALVRYIDTILGEYGYAQNR
ncbi:MAG: dTDP-4-dehydrorhamnose reductase [Clostridia bacterium]|nr:dTDP-4-dehydrorhamnose reductase [Clostridia bacterium]